MVSNPIVGLMHDVVVVVVVVDVVFLIISHTVAV